MEFSLALVELLLQFCVFFVRVCRPRPETLDILPRNPPRNLSGADPTRADFHFVYLVFQLLSFASLVVVVVFFSLRRWPYIDYAILLTAVLFDVRSTRGRGRSHTNMPQILFSAEIDLHTCYSRFSSRNAVGIQPRGLRCAATYTSLFVSVLALTSAMIWAPRPLNVTLVIAGSSLSLTFTAVAIYHLKAYGRTLGKGQAAVAWLRALFLIISCLLVLHFPELDLKVGQLKQGIIDERWLTDDSSSYYQSHLRFPPVFPG